MYHGTVLSDAEEIVAAGVDIRRGRTRTDFGAGFYTTTLARQAKSWAYQRAQGTRAGQAAVVAFDVDRERFGTLATLPFVRGDFDAEDFWSLVVHCRTGGGRHGFPGRADGMYDAVAGPVAFLCQQRLTIQGVDQISFHTRAAQDVLNSGRRTITWTSNR
ncbi:MAG TPA: DUF3990 domain-containing protein [Longimicrobium sp.]|uniref:DUF3990 domain-containing protein n=1 Tax=Longimicrobium sp. TaxID=2029185 RepID=UPI002ED91779